MPDAVDPDDALLPVRRPRSGWLLVPETHPPRDRHVVPKGKAIDREGDTAYVFAAEGNLNLRIRRRSGRLLPIKVVSPVEPTWSVLEVAVDDDGDGVVIGDQIPETTAAGLKGYPYARRFSRNGRLGRVVQVSPDSHVAAYGAQVAVAPHGRAVITWVHNRGWGYKLFGRKLGRAHRLGVSAGSAAARCRRASHRDGAQWQGDAGLGRRHLYARRVYRNGGFGPKRLIRRAKYDTQGPAPCRHRRRPARGDHRRRRVGSQEKDGQPS